MKLKLSAILVLCAVTTSASALQSRPIVVVDPEENREVSWSRDVGNTQNVTVKGRGVTRAGQTNHPDLIYRMRERSEPVYKNVVLLNEIDIYLVFDDEPYSNNSALDGSFKIYDKYDFDSKYVYESSSAPVELTLNRIPDAIHPGPTGQGHITASRSRTLWQLGAGYVGSGTPESFNSAKAEMQCGGRTVSFDLDENVVASRSINDRPPYKCSVEHRPSYSITGRINWSWSAEIPSVHDGDFFKVPYVCVLDGGSGSISDHGAVSEALHFNTQPCIKQFWGFYLSDESGEYGTALNMRHPAGLADSFISRARVDGVLVDGGRILSSGTRTPFAEEIDHNSIRVNYGAANTSTFNAVALKHTNIISSVGLEPVFLSPGGSPIFYRIHIESFSTSNAGSGGIIQFGETLGLTPDEFSGNTPEFIKHITEVYER